MNNKSKYSKVISSLSSLGFKKIQNFKEIKCGINSDVFKFKAQGINFVAKKYKHKGNLRIKREKLFYKYLKKINNKNIITPLIFSFKKNLSVYPFISGLKVKKINNKQIKKLSSFINKINNKKISIIIPKAVDGIQDRKDHLKLCEKKINQLKKVKIDSLVKKDFSNFLYKNLIPKFWEIKKNFDFKVKKVLPKMKLKKKEMIISPSDFGFHNVINKNNKLFFIDFEYAGLDDPIKLICDFYCQPDQFININQKKIFLQSLSFKYHDSKKLNSYTDLFLPFHRLKWCCIILNIFKDSKHLKNKNSSKLREKILKTQLIKSKIYFKKNLGVI